MKTLFTTVFALFTILGFSQVAIKKSSLDSGGAATTNGTLAIIYTVGELAIQENTTGTIHISEGFIGGDVFTSLGIDNYTPLESVSIFPNPTVHNVTIHFSNSDNYEINIFDYSGKQINAITTSHTNQQMINMMNYTSGIYFILVKNTDKQQYKTYKIIKE